MWGFFWYLVCFKRFLRARRFQSSGELIGRVNIETFLLKKGIPLKCGEVPIGLTLLLTEVQFDLFQFDFFLLASLNIISLFLQLNTLTHILNVLD